MILDTSTLILLAKAELLELFLGHIGQQVMIPKEVEREACGEKRSLDTLMIERAIDDGGLKVLAIKDRSICQKIAADFSLGSGEVEAIVLASSEEDLLGIDDKKGINACKLLGIPFTTAIALLVRMREKKILTRRQSLAALRELDRFGRYKSEIIEDARVRLETER